jgi:hypothetical protein
VKGSTFIHGDLKACTDECCNSKGRPHSSRAVDDNPPILIKAAGIKSHDLSADGDKWPEVALTVKHIAPGI